MVHVEIVANGQSAQTRRTLHLVSYATGSFAQHQATLADSALRHGVKVVHTWDGKALTATAFYAANRGILDRERGAGYWLWKPFIILDALNRMDEGDVLLYADAGIEVVADLSCLTKHCRDAGGLMLFAGHYEDIGALGPNSCGRWTKRDCFVLMGCDERRYYDAQMADASFLVLGKTEHARRFVSEWLAYCMHSAIVTDQPNVCGLPNLPGFIDHRHDQSVLSLLAARERIAYFRHPSQYGNHLKTRPFRQPGEWTRYEYGHWGIFENSEYGTLLNHHRGREGLGQGLTQVRGEPIGGLPAVAAMSG
jgi:hypothetical protein